MTLWAATASCSIGLVGHIYNIQYTNMLYHYTFVYVFVFVPKTWVFHGIQVRNPGAAHSVRRLLTLRKLIGDYISII